MGSQVTETDAQTALADPTSLADQWLGQVAARVDALTERWLTCSTDLCPPRLQEAMRYACLSGGKRLRPALVCGAAHAVKPEQGLPSTPAVWNVAVAIEMLHAFSLVHDDLPAMDDDDLRRGRPTVHKAFDEATAILAGDALTVRAFELLADGSVPAATAGQLVFEVAGGIGWKGVIAGQQLDLEAEGMQADLDMVRQIHRLKTAALMQVSCRSGAVAAGADAETVAQLGHFGEWLGLAFQAVDDLWDEVADESRLGKRVGRDKQIGKATLPAVVGLDRTRELAEEYIAGALGVLDRFGAAGEPLRAITGKVTSRLKAV